ncbi:MAG TPA: hypothetical protein VGM27_29010, partial [Acidobacteriaceae bacterium]
FQTAVQEPFTSRKLKPHDTNPKAAQANRRDAAFTTNRPSKHPAGGSMLSEAAHGWRLLRTKPGAASRLGSQ